MITDTLPSFADQANQVLADLQHAMDSASPVTPVMMTQIRALLTVATGAYEDRDILAQQLTLAEQKANKLVGDLKAEGGDLISTIHERKTT